MTDSDKVDTDARTGDNLISNKDTDTNKLDVKNNALDLATSNVDCESESIKSLRGTSEKDYSPVELDHQDTDEGAEEVYDNKSEYNAESFCSDDSYKASELTNITTRSTLSDCTLLLQAARLKFKEDEESDEFKYGSFKERMQKLRNLRSDEEEYSLEDEIKYLSTGESHEGRRQLRGSTRRNMSFTNDQMRRIERENQILLKKIMSYQKPLNRPNKILSVQTKSTSSAINRRKLQRKIEEDNLMLLRRIQHTKPCAMTRTATPGYRLTVL